MGRFPQKNLTRAVRKGSKLVLQEAQKNAPIDSGDLKRGVKMYAEKNRKGKKVFDIRMDRKMNNVFQKTNDQGEIIAYYPASQEYGFMAKDGSYIPGYRFMRGAMETKKQESEKKIVDELWNEIDEVLRG
jgi:hypothetical protein